MTACIRHLAWLTGAGRAGRAAVALVFGVVVSGCAAPAAIVPHRSYPEQVGRGETLDIQVFRRGRHLELTNTTARRFAGAVLWLNGRYSRDVPALAPGQHLRLPLHEFCDEFGEAFPAGGFFASELPEPVVLAELQVPGPEGTFVMYGLVAVDEPEP